MLQAVLTDLKAFERRLTEVIACLQPATMRWRSKCILNITTLKRAKLPRVFL